MGVVRARCPQPFRLMGCRRQARQIVQCPGQVADAQLRVNAQRQHRRRMPGKFLAYLDRCPASHEQRNVAHAQGVKIRHAVDAIDFGQEAGRPTLPACPPVARRLDPAGTGAAQVGADHVGCPLGHRGEHRAVRRPPVQPAAQHFGQVRPDRLAVVAPMFRADRPQHDCRRVIVQPEARRRQAA